MTESAHLPTGNLWVASWGLLAASILFTVTTLLADPVSGAVAAGAVLIPLLVLYCAVAPRTWVFLVLVSKPIVDLGWRVKFLQIGEQVVNIQTVVALLVLVLTALAAIVRARNVLLFPPIVIFGLCAGLSVLMTPTIGSLNELLRHYSGLGLFVAAPMLLESEDDLQRFAKWLLPAVSVPVLLSFLQLAEILPYEYFDDTEFGHLSRVSGTYQHPLSLVFYLIVAIPLALYLIHRNARRIGLQTLCWLFIAASLVALVFTYHRMGMAAVAIEILFWFCLTRQYGKAVLVALAGGVAVCLMLDWVSMLYRGVGELDGRFSSDAFRGRGTAWYAFVWAYLHGHPLNWLIGFGESQATADVPGVGLFTSAEAHTDFLRIWYIYGLTGIGLYLGIMATFFRKAIGLYRSRLESVRDFGALAVVVFLAVFLLSATSEPTRYPTASWFFFVVGAMVVVKHHKRLEACAPEGA